MTDPNFTAITVLLDRSGSMHQIDEGTCAGFNAFVDEQKKLPGRCALTLIRFDAPGGYEHNAINNGFVHTEVGPWYARDYFEKPIADVPRLDSVKPRGNTALHYALIKAIEETGAHYNSIAPEHRPGKVVFVVITDGEENSSPTEFSKDRIKAIVERQRHTYNWQFIFLGANQDAVLNGAGLGFSMANSSTYAGDGVHAKKAFMCASSVLRGYRSASAPDAQVAAFSAVQRAEMVGDVDTPTPVQGQPFLAAGTVLQGKPIIGPSTVGELVEFYKSIGDTKAAADITALIDAQKVWPSDPTSALTPLGVSTPGAATPQS